MDAGSHHYVVGGHLPRWILSGNLRCTLDGNLDRWGDSTHVDLRDPHVIPIREGPFGIPAVAVTMEVHERNVVLFNVVLNAAPELRLPIVTKGKDGTDGDIVGGGRVGIELVSPQNLLDPLAILIHPSFVVGIDIVGLRAHEVGPDEEHASVVECEVLSPLRLPLNS